MKTLRKPDEMRAWSLEQKRSGKTIGLVPTMGALHEGHASLMRASARDNDVSVLSIFVNPTQFGPQEDYREYPRTFDADCAMAEQIGMDAVYAPDADAMYPANYVTYVTVERLTEGLCGRTRPIHFRGVATVVAKLFNAVLPDRAYFGQKDAQQCAVVRRMTRDLDFSIEIIEMPIIRQPDGLAMSSRNRYLNANDRTSAVALSESLGKAKALMDAGERAAANVVGCVHRALSGVPGLRVDYVEVVDAEEMTPVERIGGTVLLAAAVFIGKTRLIDNIKYKVPES
ncbi:MAG: pantoate--beta-alanine ligase [Candidatus Hydrogenedentes bacterium]|nr:pantoate--beta-alanine ligase [Candidatus Hydrogenedentota bacterium]